MPDKTIRLGTLVILGMLVAPAGAREPRSVQAAVEQVMGPLPSREDLPPLAVETLEETVLGGGLVRRKVRYATETADTVSAWLFLPPEAAQGRRPAVLCLHQTTAIGKDEPAGLGGLPSLHSALELARRGFVTLAPDYPSFGEHAYDFSSRTWQSGSLKAVWDNMRGVDLLADLSQVDPDRIGCIGHSLGGHNAIFTAVFRADSDHGLRCHRCCRHAECFPPEARRHLLPAPLRLGAQPPRASPRMRDRRRLHAAGRRGRR